MRSQENAECSFEEQPHLRVYILEILVGNVYKLPILNSISMQDILNYLCDHGFMHTVCAVFAYFVYLRTVVEEYEQCHQAVMYGCQVVG